MISIIVPVYNAKRFLNECLDSVLNQTYSDFEVLMINDGSTDGSEAICKEYSLKDKRFRLINKKNSGVCAARNTGLQSAIGDYIAFLDSDDTLKEDFLQKLLYAININKADVAVCDFCINGVRENPKWENGVFTKGSILNEYAKGAFLNRIMNKLYVKDIIKGSIFPVDRPIMEDAAWTAENLSRCNKVVLVAEGLYNYRMVENSLSHRKMSEFEEVGKFANFISKINVLLQHTDESTSVIIENDVRKMFEQMMLSFDDLTQFHVFDDMKKIASGINSKERVFLALKECNTPQDAQKYYYWSMMRSCETSLQGKIKYTGRRLKRSIEKCMIK